MEEEAKPIRQLQRRLNPHLQEVVRAEVLKLLQAGIIYPISDSPWVSPTQVVPKKSGITVVQNEKGEEITTRLTSGWRVCIDYRKLNVVTRKDHFPLPFIDQVLERVSGHPFYCFLDGYLGYFQIEIDVVDQEKTTFTCPFGTYAYRRMPFGLCNAPATFQRCMLSIFSDMVERIMEVFMDDITVYGGIVLGHIISEKGIEVDKAKVELIVKLPSTTTVKGVRQFLGHAGFYRRFIKAEEFFNNNSNSESPNWQLPFELMCDASDFAIGVVLGQREDGKPYVIYYASKTLNEAQRNYTTTEKELLAVVFALDKFRAYLVGSFIIVFTDHSALKYLLTKQDAKARSDHKEVCPEDEQQGILSHCHENACGGHFASQKTSMRVLQSGFTWPSLFKDAHIMSRIVLRRSTKGRTGSTHPHLIGSRAILLKDWFFQAFPCLDSDNAFDQNYCHGGLMLNTWQQGIYDLFCQDDMPMVKRSAASNLGKFAATVEAAHSKADIMSIFEDLTQDDQDSVRLLVV
ncbi:Retrovirus-related Pol polyprotein from transposon 17.6 [Vitis vinifera]|uniref:Retrovirus-related Pol polyprotein from transposon 17.6 n=1 Tax=Vitis vinifera TaxID=29760 RepID=A0A438G6W1_VITVI|nr:Retrovirus-related Pol polyprotein from transposon 17.6 [Vitis vinifera]